MTVRRTLRQHLDTLAWDAVDRVAPHRLGPARADWAAARLGSELSRLDAQRRGDPLHLAHFEQSIRAQNGEDGVIAEIFRRVGERDRTFVEFGAADGTENCTAALVDAGWSGVWIEGDSSLADAARRHVGDRPVAVLDAFIDRDNIVDLLCSGGAPESLDLLVVDIDGNDHDVLAAVLERHRPRVLVAEYNAAVGPRSRWTMRYDAGHTWSQDWRYGVSLRALAGLAGRHGLRLVGCDTAGVNAFFVHDDDVAAVGERSVDDAWVPPLFHLPYGHPPRRWQPFTSPRLDDTAAAAIRVEPVVVHTDEVVAGGTVVAYIEVNNGTDSEIGEASDHPVRVTWNWVDGAGVELDGEPVRALQRWRAAPGVSAGVVVIAQAPAAGQYRLRIKLVQEDVRWLDASVDSGVVDVT